MAVVGKNRDERAVGRPVPVEMRRAGILGRLDGLSFSEFKKLPLLEQLELMAGAFKEKEDALDRFYEYKKLKLYRNRQEKLVKKMLPELLKQKAYDKLVEVLRHHWPEEKAIDFLLNETKQLKHKEEIAALMTAIVQGALIKEMFDKGEIDAYFYTLEKIVGMMKEIGIKPSKEFSDAVNNYLLEDVFAGSGDYNLLGDIIKANWVKQSIKKAALEKLPETIELSCEVDNNYEAAAEFIVTAKEISPKTLENAIAALFKKSSDSGESLNVFKILMTGDDKLKELALKKYIDLNEPFLIFEVVEFYIETTNKRLEKVVEAKMKRLLAGVKETLEHDDSVSWHYLPQLQKLHDKLANKKGNEQYLPTIKKLVDFVLKAAEKNSIHDEARDIIIEFINGNDISEEHLKRAVKILGIDIKEYTHPLTGEIDLDGVRIALKQRDSY
ncbi:MAG: hypothetical protein QXN37_00725 [Candidatus Anstonellaceae archaeon]